MLNKNSKVDKLAERDRYNLRAKHLSSSAPNLNNTYDVTGAFAVPLLLRGPYLYYEQELRSLLNRDSHVLEIGSGTGMHTEILLMGGANVTATDISEHSLEILRMRFRKFSNLRTKVADMESLPFGERSFDIVVSAGSLSYGDSEKVLSEIYRVLKPNGVFLCVDTLNHNPIYRFNRWLHYLRGNRTLSTLKRMPTSQTFDLYRNKFGNVDLKFFGSAVWAIKLIEKLVGENLGALLSEKLDCLIGVKISAFKFVMIARKGGNER
jgi:ubiquinone/menaquinone biosynthesis C-methylase UbiE